MGGTLHPDVRVPLREITLAPTHTACGITEQNPPVRVYDTSGPWGDDQFQGDSGQGLPALRADWIRQRGDVEEVFSSYKPISGRSDAVIPDSLRRKPLRAKPGKVVTQFHYARQGIVTPEMEFIAIRENLGREAAAKNGSNLRNLGGEAFGARIPDLITPEYVRDATSMSKTSYRENTESHSDIYETNPIRCCR